MSDTLMYDLPDTVKLGLTEAQAYAVAWDTFHRIQKEAPHAMVYYSGCYNVLSLIHISEPTRPY